MFNRKIPGASYYKNYVGSLLSRQVIFTVISALLLLVMTTVLRFALLVYNRELIGDIAPLMLLTGFFNGARFDARIVALVCVPLVLTILSSSAIAARGWQRLWLVVCSSLIIFLGVVELDFYREFHQRLNGLVLQYIREDPATVISMLWHGFPVIKLILAWGAATYIMALCFFALDKKTRTMNPRVVRVSEPPWYTKLVVFALCFLLSIAAVRGTLRQGPPLRWGDAFTTDSVFVNHLGLNGVLTLYTAIANQMSDHRNNLVQNALPESQARQLTRDLLMVKSDQLIDPDSAAIRRISESPDNLRLPIKNVVVILMESFAGRFVGALGSEAGITPNFDQLASEGLLFRRFFSNGTHTHQGMFATMACFPNLPGFEYLMQTPEGGHQFSGLPQLLSRKNFDDVYVYNGDFAWDNQRGFFSNQGMSHFVGRDDFDNPVFSDPTWGVSDEDMFERAHRELLNLHSNKKPFYAFLQTLSNHTPYALPEKLPVNKVVGHGTLNEHLTAMRYSDWALGQFFEKARKAPYFNDTLFVVVGDHGFGTPEQLTEIDLYRFHVPLLLIGSKVVETFGNENSRVGSQVDIVPTIMGRVSGKVQHQCWGRDLLNLSQHDQGFAIIKPSGGDQTSAIIEGDRILVKPEGLSPKLYRYHLGAGVEPETVAPTEITADMTNRLNAYLQTATTSLLTNTAGMFRAAGKETDDQARTKMPGSLLH